MRSDTRPALMMVKLRDIRMRRFFAGGLLVAVLVLLQGQLRLALDAVHAFEARVGLALVPSAMILAVMLLLYFQAQRHEQRLRRSVADAQIRERQGMDSVLAGLSRFGLALVRANDMGGVRDVVQLALPQFTGTRPFWAVVRTKGTWESIAGGLEERTETVSAEVQKLAAEALKRFEGSIGEPEGMAWGGRVYYPLVVGDESTGVLAVEMTSEGETGDGSDWRRLLGSAVALVGLAGRNAQLARAVEENGIFDGLTGCLNRTHGMGLLQTELQRARRHKAPFGLIMLDLDHFKAINDTYGHLCGDAMLTAVGQRLRDVLRDSDAKCRYGGEEFMVLLPDTPRPGALHVAESLRQQLEKTSVTWQGKMVSTTASVGLAMALPKEVNSSVLLARADAALYLAKDRGRNQVCESELPATSTTTVPQPA